MEEETTETGEEDNDVGADAASADPTVVEEEEDINGTDELTVERQVR